MDTSLSASSSSQGGLVPAAYVSQLFIARPTTIAAGCRSKLSRPSEPPACRLRKTPPTASCTGSGRECVPGLLRLCAALEEERLAAGVRGSSDAGSATCREGCQSAAFIRR